MKFNHQPRFKMAFLAPKYWGIWFGFGILRLLGFLPYKAKIKFGEGLGQFIYALSIKRKRFARQNLQIAFPEKSAAEIEELLKQHFKSLGVGLMEITINLWGKYHTQTDPTQNEFQYMKFYGVENLKAYPNQGKILLVPHFTSIEMTGLMMSFLTDYRPIYRPHDNPLLEYFITKSRTFPNNPNQYTAIPIPNTDTLPMVKALRKYQTLAILPDQKYSGKGSLNVPFFGISAASNPGINKLAKMGKAVIIPCFTRRIGLEYQLHILPALENFPSGDDEADTLRLHHLYEDEIKQNPSQYLWVHDRWSFKNNPAKFQKALQARSQNQ